MTTMIVVNIVLSAVVLVGLAALLGVSVATQKRDLGVTLDGRARSRSAAAPQWGAATRREAWPAV